MPHDSPIVRQAIRGSSHSWIRRPKVKKAANRAILIIGLWQSSISVNAQQPQGSSEDLTRLNLEQLGNVEVTTASKEPEQVWQTPAAIYVISQEDIRRSGATSIPEVL